jgi:hypothetical protein
MVVGLELVAGYLVTGGEGAQHVGTRLDEASDQVIDAGLDRWHAVVAMKLGSGMRAIWKLRLPRSPVGGPPRREADSWWHHGLASVGPETRRPVGSGVRGLAGPI